MKNALLHAIKVLLWVKNAVLNVFISVSIFYVMYSVTPYMAVPVAMPNPIAMLCC